MNVTFRVLNPKRSASSLDLEKQQETTAIKDHEPGNGAIPDGLE